MATLNDNDPFDAFLNKKTPEDDFEREAMEGLNSLPLPELHVLKKTLDERVETIYVKKTRPFGWVAMAAGLLLLTSLSIITWYYLQPTDVAVAMHASKPISETITPQAPSPNAPTPVTSSTTTPQAQPLPVIVEKETILQPQLVKKTSSDESSINLQNSEAKASAAENLDAQAVTAGAVYMDSTAAISLATNDAPTRADEGAVTTKKYAKMTRSESETYAAMPSVKPSSESTPAITTKTNCLSTHELKKLRLALYNQLKETPYNVAFNAKVSVGSTGKMTIVEFLDPSISDVYKKEIQLKLQNIEKQFTISNCQFLLEYSPSNN